MKEIDMLAMARTNGFRLGNAQDRQGGTGCTVLVFPESAPCAVDVRGGGPASRESELLSPMAAASGIHAILLSGGSAFGLNASAGVMQYLGKTAHRLRYAHLQGAPRRRIVHL